MHRSYSEMRNDKYFEWTFVSAGSYIIIFSIYRRNIRPIKNEKKKEMEREKHVNNCQLFMLNSNTERLRLIIINTREQAGIKYF